MAASSLLTRQKSSIYSHALVLCWAFEHAKNGASSGRMLRVNRCNKFPSIGAILVELIVDLRSVHRPLRAAPALITTEFNCLVFPANHLFAPERKIFTTPPGTKRTMPELREIVPRPWPVAKEPRCAAGLA